MSEKIPRRKLPRLKIVERNSFILDRCRGKRVLHVGCTDYPFTESKFNAGDLLHMQLEPVASELIGIDIDAPSVQWLQQQGVKNLHVMDAHDAEKELPALNFSPEVVVAGEVLEHLSAPAEFLKGIAAAMQPQTRLLISVPNAFWSEGFLHVLLGREKVHEEHVAYYSYYTLQQLLMRAGLEAEEIRPCRYAVAGGRKKLTDALMAPLRWISPHFAPGYVLSARLKGTE